MVKSKACCTCDKRKQVYSKGLCRSCYEKRLRATNPEFSERQRANRRAWAERNPDKIAAHQRRRLTDPRARARDATSKRRRHLQSISSSEEHLASLRTFQGNKCAICERSLAAVGAEHIDHCHGDGGIRGLLCSRCNNGLGMFCDSPTQLSKAIEYLANPPARRLNLEK